VSRAIGGLLALLLLVPGLARAQSLGDAAAREKQKRAAAGPRPQARVLSNDDLQKDKDAGTGSKSAPASAAPAATDSGASPRVDPDERGQPSAGKEESPREAQLRQAQAAVDEARSAVVSAEERVKALGDKLNPMSPSFIYGAAQSGDAAGEEIRTREELKAAEAQLATARDALVAANRAHENVRQGRVPASSDR
jgi:hypothetical protein